MKRSPMPGRDKPMTRGEKPLGRTTPMPRASKKPTAGRARGGATGELKPLNDFSPAVRATVRVRSAGICEACGQEPARIHHHRRPRRRDGWRPGTNEPSNALHIGLRCDERIERQDRKGALALGQLLNADQDPAAVPVSYRGMRCLLTDDGAVVPVREADAA